MAPPLTLLGVLIQNYCENARTTIKLEHEAKQKEIDRLQNAKRQIYLEAAVEVSKVLTLLHKTSNFEISQSELNDLLSGYHSANIRVHLLGNLKTIKTFEEANETFQDHYWKLCELRSPYIEKIEQLKTIQVQISEDLKMLQNLIKRFEQVQRNSPSNPELSKLTDSYNNVRDRFEASQKQRKQLVKEIHEGTIIVYKQTQQAIYDYAAKLRLVNIAARDELGLPLPDNGDEYRALLESFAEKQMQRVNGFLAKSQTPSVPIKSTDKK